PLHSIKGLVLVPHGLDIADPGGGKPLELRREHGYLIGMRGPGPEPWRKAFQDIVLLYQLHIHLGIATDAAWHHPTAKGGAHNLHAQAYPQDGNVKLHKIIATVSGAIQRWS